MNTLQSDALVFFGATGDLAFKQIFPALMALVDRHGLKIPIVGVAKATWGLDQFRQRAEDSLKAHGNFNEASFEKLLPLLKYVDGDYRDPKTYECLRTALDGAKSPLHYLAIPPAFFGTVVEGLAKSECAMNARVVVEKPFGRDLASAKELNRILESAFPEECIFRIDHFLGKEPVQNILYTRFANFFFEPVWNRVFIRSMQITMAEDFGVAGRGAFYEEAGCIRDVVQNHLLQILACLTMDPPRMQVPDSMRDEKSRVLKAVRPLAPEDVVRGQFNGYRKEKGVAPNSDVETYAALRLFIDTWRWSDVPFFIRAGKCLPVTATEVIVDFKRPPRDTFGEKLSGPGDRLRLRLSPEVLIALGMRVKVPGEPMVGEEVELIATHQTGSDMAPYERLLGDALRGDQTLFANEEAVEAQWRVVDPVLRDPAPCIVYEPGTWGPKEADRLTEEFDGWLDPQATAK
ncbi:MAG TPA: glucose-6-phosphate dehydrogenase [Bryobacteraceae bacterium]|jgi:glucose-6-phosphate 1-dehydrogenase|nr:glucose-6-phosphate dehydrogenase [Bryobacteraceae bacterium]